jgi:hypothetical protein
MTLSRQARKLALEKLYPPTDPYTNDPVGWMNRRCRRFLWSKQKQILESVRDNRFTAVPSCHGPGKSFTASGAGAWWLDSHPPGDAFLVTTAPTDSQVKTILWRELRRRHREAKMSGRITLEAQWYQGEKMVDEEIIGLGRKPQDYDPDAFQGIHAKYVLVIVDEATGVPKQLFDALETLMTNDYARMLAIGNPDDPTSYFETICRPGSGWNVIRIPAHQTPNFTGEPVPQDVAEVLVTPLWVKEREQKWGKTSPLYISKVLAEFPEISSDTLITPAMVRAAMAKMMTPTRLGQYGSDVARYGPDETVVYYNRGGHVRLVYRGHQQPTDQTRGHFARLLLQHGPEYVPMYIDVVGIGGGVVDEMHADGLNVYGIHVGLKADDPQRFANKRAEMYWRLREMFEAGELDIDPEDEDLHSQLSSLRWFITRKGQIAIESKEDMKRRGLPSPDRADAFMLATVPGAERTGPAITIIGKTIAGDLMTRVM